MRNKSVIANCCGKQLRSPATRFCAIFEGHLPLIVPWSSILSHSDTMTQNPVLNVESHLSYDVTKTLWVSADYYYHYGGAKTVNDVSFDSLSNSTVGGTVGFNIAPSYQLLFQ